MASAQLPASSEMDHFLISEMHATVSLCAGDQDTTLAE